MDSIYGQDGQLLPGCAELGDKVIIRGHMVAGTGTFSGKFATDNIDAARAINIANGAVSGHISYTGLKKWLNPRPVVRGYSTHLDFTVAIPAPIEASNVLITIPLEACGGMWGYTNTLTLTYTIRGSDGSEVVYTASGADFGTHDEYATPVCVSSLLMQPAGVIYYVSLKAVARGDEWLDFYGSGNMVPYHLGYAKLATGNVHAEIWKR